MKEMVKAFVFNDVHVANFKIAKSISGIHNEILCVIVFIVLVRGLYQLHAGALEAGKQKSA
jgi:hypothetical protein